MFAFSVFCKIAREAPAPSLPQLSTISGDRFRISFLESVTLCTCERATTLSNSPECWGESRGPSSRLYGSVNSGIQNEKDAVKAGMSQSTRLEGASLSNVLSYFLVNGANTYDIGCNLL